MKRLVLIIVTVTLLCLFTGNALAANSEFLLGDINCDDEIDASDARLILRAAVKLESLPDDIMKSADVDGNGEVEAADARIVLRVAVKIENIIDYYSEKIYEIYRDVFKIYVDGFNNNFYNDKHFETYYGNEFYQDDPFDKNGRYPNPLTMVGGIPTKISFTFIDFSKDGIPELLISKNDESMLDAFGVENGKVYRLFNAGAMYARSRFYIFKNGIIYNVGSGGAFSHSHIFFSLPKNSTNPIIENEFIVEETKSGTQYQLIDNETKIYVSERSYYDIISQYSANNSFQWKVLCKSDNC